jgi:hypothetical protein
MRIALIVFSTILAFSTTASGQSLSGDQIRETLIGNTLSGVEDGKSYSEHLNPDGTISGRSASGSYSGRWRISGNRICFLYAEGSTKSDCTEVSLDGDRITWGDNTTATLSKPAPVSHACRKIRPGPPPDSRGTYDNKTPERPRATAARSRG